MYVEPKDQSAWVYFDWLIPHLCLLCTLSLTISVKTHHMHITCGPTVNCLDEDAKRPLLEDEIHQCDELLGVEPDCVCLSISSPFFFCHTFCLCPCITTISFIPSLQWRC